MGIKGYTVIKQHSPESIETINAVNYPERGSHRR